MIVFYLSYFGLIFYLLFRKGYIDIYFVAAIGLLAYFFPYFFIDSDSELYLLVSIPLIFFLLNYIFSDIHLKNSATPLYKETSGLIFISLTFTLLMLTILIYQAGIIGFISGKDGSYSLHVYGFFVSALSLGLILSALHKKKLYFIIFSLLMLMLFITGTRTHLVMAILSLFVLLNLGKRIRVIYMFTKLNYILVFIFVFVLGVLGKDIYASVAISVLNDSSFFSVLVQRLSQFSFVEILSRTEPFHVAGMFQLIQENNYRIDSSYMLDLPFHFLPVSGSFTNSLHWFSESIKAEFYTGWSKEAGVSSNFWAEGFALYGLYGLFLFTLLWNVGLCFFNYIFYKAQGSIKALALLSGVFWGFYIHRNSFFQIISHEKRVIYGYILLVLITLIYKGVINVSFINRRSNIQ